MNDKIVTHADLDLLREMREQADYGRIHQAPLLDRLIAAAEADQPPLPEGWVLLNTTKGYRALWHEDGDLYEHNMLGGGVWAKVGEIPRDRLTPLRPTVTEAEVSEMAESLGAALLDGHSDCASLLLALARGGIEVTP